MLDSSSAFLFGQVILNGVAGEARGGQMLALMGASGAGKTSLLDCISLRNRAFTGNVYLNGAPVSETFYSTTGA
jgi:ABC-type multidrug transport system ATPase subunit